MPFRFAHRFVLACAAALLVCEGLYLAGLGFPVSPSLMCCGDSLPMLFLCLIPLLSLFSIIAVVLASIRQHSGGSPSPMAQSSQFGHLTSLVFSDYFREWFAVSLLLGTPLVLLGAALLFSLSERFAPSAASLGTLSVLCGLLFPFLGGGHPGTHERVQEMTDVSRQTFADEPDHRSSGS